MAFILQVMHFHQAPVCMLVASSRVECIYQQLASDVFQLAQLLCLVRWKEVKYNHVDGVLPIF